MNCSDLDAISRETQSVELHDGVGGCSAHVNQSAANCLKPVGDDVIAIKRACDTTRYR